LVIIAQRTGGLPLFLTFPLPLSQEWQRQGIFAGATRPL
jgi:hypothetical protein